MEAVGIALSAAQTLFTALQCWQLKEMCSIFGKESELVEFQNIVDTVKAVLLDADKKDNIPDKKTQLYIQQLKDAVYDADDLLDEFVTVAEQIQQMKGGKAYEKLHHFFSSRNPLAAAFNVSRGVKKIRKNLDVIASNHSNFGLSVHSNFSVDSQPIRRRREETCSYVYERNVIGREDDIEKIVGVLLDSNIKEDDVSFLTIVGIGGLGKTALAQLVFNDARVTSAFPLKLWTCVSDHEREKLDAEGILRKILASAIGHKDEESTMDFVQCQLRELLVRNKYLLVLDDVWTEDRNDWHNLVEFLLGVQKGSWIVVTTRSHETARIVGDGSRHKLQGLSKEDSLLLFEKIAFGSERSNAHHGLVEIGRDIVEQCAGVPLAIRVVGSLLYGQDISKWLSFQKIGLSNSRDSQKNIMPILELSYHQLESPLKTCFTYCALFPKDFVIKKELLICLWMAQGFIVPLDEGQKVQDAAEEYFSILLRRCFFQEVECDDYGGILACKIHDLMHDMAQKLAGKEVCVTNFVVNNVGEKVRHLALVRGRCAQHSFTKNHIRSYLFVGGRSVDTKMQQHSVEALISKWVCLRALDLSESGLNSLPDSIGELLHLRFLDLSRNYYLKVLPKSFTKLCNLETLILTRCLSLIELPKDLRKLVKLRVLDIKQCNRLTSMPRGIGKLSCLDTLSRFLVSSPSWKQLFDDVEELKDLRNLRGALSMEITFPNKCNDPEVDGGDKMEGAYLTKKQHLNVITFQFSGKADADEEALRLIEELQPHSNLKGLELCGFIGARMPSWARGDNLTAFLPNLIRLQLSNLSIKYVTCLGNLLHLKALKIEFLSELENIIEYSEPTTSTSTIAAIGLTMATTEGLSSSLFPSLERLELIFLPKLNGWGRSRMGDWVEDEGELIHDNNRSMEPLLLPHLKTLRIKSCPNLESTMLCPFLEELNLQKYNKKTLDIVRPLSLALSKEIEIKKAEALSLSCFSSGTSWKTKIRDVELLKSLPMESLPSLDHMHIVEDNDVESLGEVGEVIFSNMTSLRLLNIESCSNLRSVSGGGLEHLTSLEHLGINECPNLSLAEEERQDGIDIGIPWRSLSHSLCHLTLANLPQLVDLPNQMQFLTALRILEIDNCQGLESLPNWMPKLISLRHLGIWFCSAHLEERCQDSNGEDWPHIEHIPSVEFLFCFY